MQPQNALFNMRASSLNPSAHALRSNALFTSGGGRLRVLTRPRGGKAGESHSSTLLIVPVAAAVHTQRGTAL